MGESSTDLTGITDREVAALSTVLGMLGDPTRLRLVLLLCERERCVGDLVKLLRLPQPTVSHHLALLRRTGVLTTRREGKSIFYGLDSRLEFAEDGCELRLRNAPGVTILITRRRAAAATAGGTFTAAAADSASGL